MIKNKKTKKKIVEKMVFNAKIRKNKTRAKKKKSFLNEVLCLFEEK